MCRMLRKMRSEISKYASRAKCRMLTARLATPSAASGHSNRIRRRRFDNRLLLTMRCICLCSPYSYFLRFGRWAKNENTKTNRISFEMFSAILLLLRGKLWFQCLLTMQKGTHACNTRAASTLHSVVDDEHFSWLNFGWMWSVLFVFIWLHTDSETTILYFFYTCTHTHTCALGTRENINNV